MVSKEYITAISIFDGLIQLIEPDGTIGYYRQRGIDKLTPEQFERCVRAGVLRPDIMQFPELPKNYVIESKNHKSWVKHVRILGCRKEFRR